MHEPIKTGPLTPRELSRFRVYVERNRMAGTQDFARLYMAYLSLLQQLQETT